MKEKIKNLKDNKLINYVAPIITLAVMCLLFAVISEGRFTRSANIQIIVNQALVVAIVATGGVFIYASGNMNTAMGGSTGIACVVGALVYLATGSHILTIFSCIGTGLLIMGLCLVLSQFLKISIIVITMILMTMLVAVQEWMVGADPIQLSYADMKILQDSNLPLILGLIFFAVCLFLFNFTKMGKTLMFIGENSTCSRQTGINERKNVSIAFIISGVAIGLGAFALVVRSTTVATTTAGSLNMDVILAIVLAGTPMNGGTKSKVFSGLVGAFMVIVLNNGLLMAGVTSIYIQAVRGVLFIVVLALSARRPDVLPVKDMV